MIIHYKKTNSDSLHPSLLLTTTSFIILFITPRLSTKESWLNVMGLWFTSTLYKVSLWAGVWWETSCSVEFCNVAFISVGLSILAVPIFPPIMKTNYFWCSLKETRDGFSCRGKSARSLTLWWTTCTCLYNVGIFMTTMIMLHLIMLLYPFLKTNAIRVLSTYHSSKLFIIGIL